MRSVQKEKSAGAVIFCGEKDQNYYLLLHYESGHWDFPKGHIEKGEEEKETVLREVKEETGIKDIKFIPNFRESITYFFRKTYEKSEKPPLIYKEVVFYLAKSKQKEVEISFEHIGYKWLLYEEALEQLTFKNAKDILKKAESFLISSKTR